MTDGIDDAINAQLHRQTTIDYLIVSDRAEVLNNKLYLMGGGWDRLQPPAYPFPMMIGIALGIRIPFHQTDDSHRVIVTLQRDEGEELLKMEADVQTGRPPGMRGMDMLVPMAFNAPVTIAREGTLVLSASVDGHEPRRHEIRAVKRGT